MSRLSCLILVAPAVAAASCGTDEVPWPAAGGSIACEPLAAAQKTALAWLRANAPPWDLMNEYSLFGAPGGVDGLEFGVASVGVNASLAAKMRRPWAAAVPRDVFDDYSLPYACVNEPRTDWRALVGAAVDPVVDALPAGASLDDVIAAINGYGANASDSVWARLGGVVFKSSQTPLIYDPVSTAAFGYASCTGVSVTFVAALRAAGVPARLVGTPAWRGDPANGNHNWVEIYREGNWSFIEAHPAGGGETLDDPCDKWFCNAAHFPSGKNATTVFAARFDRVHNDSVYPMAWDPTNLDVPGVDRTADYFAMCSKC